MNYTKIKGLKAACKVTGRDYSRAIPYPKPENSLERGANAFMAISIMTEAINNDDPALPPFIPNFNDNSQDKWSLWYYGGDHSGSGFRLYVPYYVWANAAASGGARFAFRDKKRAVYAAPILFKLHKQFFLILKK